MNKIRVLMKDNLLTTLKEITGNIRISDGYSNVVNYFLIYFLEITHPYLAKLKINTLNTSD